MGLPRLQAQQRVQQLRPRGQTRTTDLERHSERCKPWRSPLRRSLESFEGNFSRAEQRSEVLKQASQGVECPPCLHTALTQPQPQPQLGQCRVKFLTTTRESPPPPYKNLVTVMAVRCPPTLLFTVKHSLPISACNFRRISFHSITHGNLLPVEAATCQYEVCYPPFHFHYRCRHSCRRIPSYGRCHYCGYGTSRMQLSPLRLQR